ncbi:MAG: TetR/AcrR family transcriptional regulator [Rhodothermales bacterium]
MEQPEFKSTVLDASRRLLLEQGFDHVSMRKIAAEAGCKASTLYYYFKNKEEIVAALVEEGTRLHYRIAKEIARKHANPLLRFEALLWTSLEFGLNNQAMFEILFMGPGAGGDGQAGLHRAMPGYDLAAEALRECAAGGLATVEDAGLACATCFAMLNGVVYSLLYRQLPPTLSVDRVKRDAVKRIMASLKG